MLWTCTKRVILVSPRLKSTDIDIGLKSPYTFSYNERKWVKSRAASPYKTNIIRSRRDKSTIVSREKRSADVGGDSIGAEEHRVMEWIRDCNQPSLNLMDDVPKIQGLQHFQFTDDRVFIDVNCSPRKSLRICRSRNSNDQTKF